MSFSRHGAYQLFLSAIIAYFFQSDLVLTIPLATLEISRDLIKQALSTIENADVTDWETQNFGQSTLSKRKIAFNS